VYVWLSKGVVCWSVCCALQILGVHLQRRGLPLAPDVQVDEIAAMTTGFTGADLANLVNEVCEGVAFWTQSMADFVLQ